MFFPRASRDNFGAAIGLANYIFRWHIGDRLTLVSYGMYDFFNQGEKITTIGLQLSRPAARLFRSGCTALSFRSASWIRSNTLLTTSYSLPHEPEVGFHGIGVVRRPGWEWSAISLR